MKSGTTYLSGLLGSHPDIFICTPSEPCYFGNPAELRRVWPQAWRNGIWKSEGDYLKLFRDAGSVKYIGEASTTYSKVPTITSVAAQIFEYAPDARIVYVMRDPINRTISHYWHMVRWHCEYRHPLAAIRHDPYYTSVSHYARQIAPYLNLFGPRNVMALTYESLVSEPENTVRALYEWLGVDTTFVPGDIREPANVMPDVIEKARAFGLPQRLRKSQAWSRVARYCPGALRRGLAALAVRRVRPAETSMDAVIRYLRPIQREQTRDLGRMLSRSFPEWTTLGDYRFGPASPICAPSPGHVTRDAAGDPSV